MPASNCDGSIPHFNCSGPLGATSPETFDALAEAERLLTQAWVASIEAATAGDHWEPNDDITGSLSGHPSQEEEGPRRVYLGDPGLDETYAN